MQINQPASSGHFDWNKKWVGWIVGGLALACIGSHWIDREVAASGAADGIPGDLRRIVELSEIFAHGFGVLLVLVLLWTLAPQLRRMLPRLAACAVLSGLTAQLIKLTVARRRPNSFEPEMTEPIGDTWVGLFPNWEIGSQYSFQSFPSAHTATAIGLAIGLSWLCPRGRNIFFVLAFLASFQRISSGAHWVSDVFAGAAVSVTVCFLIFRPGLLNSAFTRIEMTRENEDDDSSEYVQSGSTSAA